jgi:flagellar biosynthesis/type III secretory pathway ATPase
MTETKWWDKEEYWVNGLLDDGWNIPAILSEHTKRIIKELEEVTKYERHECFCSGCSWKDGWNAALDEAIKKVSELGG